MSDAEYTYGRPAVYLTDIERARLLILKSKIRDAAQEAQLLARLDAMREE